MAVGLSLCVVVLLTGCVSSGKYGLLQDELARTQDDLSLTETSLRDAEDMLVDVDSQRAMLEERAALVDQLAADKAELESRLQELISRNAIPTVDGTVLFAEGGRYGYRMPGDVVFASGSDKLTKQGEQILNDLAAELKANGRAVQVIGHTDTDPIKKTKDVWKRGNIQLGANRAMTVREFLVGHGIDEGRVSIASFGASKPIAAGKSAEAKSKNRRVEVMLDYDPADGS